MQQTPSTSSSSAKATDGAPSFRDELAEVTAEAKHLKVRLSPEIEQLIRDNVKIIEDKLMAGRRLKRRDLAFLDTVKRWIRAEQLKLPGQYRSFLETLNFFGLNKPDDAPVPFYEKTAASFTVRELEIARTFQEPALILIPECSFARKVAAIDGKKTMKGQRDCYVNDIDNDPVGAKPEITGWRAVIVDGARGMALKPGDDKGAKLKDRLAARKAARRSGEKGMDRHSYAMLMMKNLKDGAPIDLKTYTLLDDDPANSSSGVPNARWNDDRVYFFWYDPDLGSAGARLRSRVGGNVLIF